MAKPTQMKFINPEVNKPTYAFLVREKIKRKYHNMEIYDESYSNLPQLFYILNN